MVLPSDLMSPRSPTAANHAQVNEFPCAQASRQPDDADGSVAESVRVKEWKCATCKTQLALHYIMEESYLADDVSEVEFMGEADIHQHMMQRLHKAIAGCNSRELSDAIVQAEVNYFGANEDIRVLLAQAKQALRVVRGRRLLARHQSCASYGLERRATNACRGVV